MENHFRGLFCISKLQSSRRWDESDFCRKHYDHTDTVGPFEDTEFPQRKIYLDIIPKIVKSLCDVQYWANSPWGGAEIANDTTIGDIHQWDGKFISITTSKAYLTHSSMARQIPLLPELQESLRTLHLRVRHARFPRHAHRQ
jgi:hypothetical protein